MEPLYQSGLRAQSTAEITTNQPMGKTAMPTDCAAAPYQPTSRHVSSPTSLNSALLAEAFLRQTVKHASQSSHICLDRCLISVPELYLSNNISSNYIRELHIVHHYLVTSTQLSPWIADFRWHIFGQKSRTS